MQTYIDKLVEEISGNAVDIIFNREAGWSGKLEESIKTSLHSLLAEVKRRVPEKKEFKNHTLLSDCQRMGYNQCIDEINKRLNE